MFVNLIRIRKVNKTKVFTKDPLSSMALLRVEVLKLSRKVDQ